MDSSSGEGAAATPGESLRLLNEQIATARRTLADLQAAIGLARSDAGLLALSKLATENERLERASRQASDEVDTANAALERAVRAAETDALTGLPNRTLLLDRLGHDIRLAKRNGKRLAVLFMDLDNFKPINDSLGHAVGDLVLQHVASSLTSAVRSSDTVSRHGGDEFVVLFSEVAGRDDAQRLSAKITAKLSEPCWSEGRALSLSASIGIALYPEDGEDAETLIAHADGTMYANKRANR